MARKNSIAVYPNPVESWLQVQVNSTTSGQVSVVLLDMSGSQVYEAQVKTNEATSLDLSNLKQGIYLLQLIDETGEVQTKRILKQ